MAGGGGVGGGGEGGFYVTPTVIADMPPSARAMNEEPFGPLALIGRFVTQLDANRGGRPAALRGGCLLNRLAVEIEAGMIAINQMRLTWPAAPFGGVKASGFGSEGLQRIW